MQHFFAHKSWTRSQSLKFWDFWFLSFKAEGVRVVLDILVLPNLSCCPFERQKCATSDLQRSRETLLLHRQPSQKGREDELEEECMITFPNGHISTEFLSCLGNCLLTRHLPKKRKWDLSRARNWEQLARLDLEPTCPHLTRASHYSPSGRVCQMIYKKVPKKWIIV